MGCTFYHRTRPQTQKSNVGSCESPRNKPPYKCAAKPRHSHIHVRFPNISRFYQCWSFIEYDDFSLYRCNVCEREILANGSKEK